MHKQTLVHLVLLSLAISVAAGCGGAQQRKARYIERGQQYLTQKNYQKARIEFGNALQIDPKDVHARYLAGQVAERLGDPRSAVGEYQAAIELDPAYSTARAAMARLYVFGGVPDKAIELVETGLALNPKDPQLLTARGAARARLGDQKGALADAELAYNSAPDDQYSISLLCSLYKQAGRGGEALQVAQSGVEHLPDNVDLRVVLASLELDQNQPEKAEADLKRTIELEPSNPERRFELARFYLIRKNVDAAEQTIRDAVKAAPDNLKVKQALIDFELHQRGADQAEAEIKRFIAADPDNDDLKLALGSFSVEAKNPDQAEAVYRDVIKHAGVKPDGLIARDRLAALMLSRSDVKSAETLIGEVLKENANDNDALMMRANIEITRGDASAAITDLRTVQRAQPNSTVVLRTLARAHLQNKEPQLAEEVLRSAVQANPKDADSRFELAELLAQTGKPDQALPILNELSSEAPENLTIIQEQFRTELAVKDFAAARVVAERQEHDHADSPLGFYFAGAVDEAQQKPDAAIADYEHALNVAPRAGEPLAALVRLSVERKQTKLAMSRLDATIQKFPDDIFARNLKAELFLSEKQYDQAEEAYRDIIVLKPDIWTLYRGLADAQLGENNNDAAIVTLNTGIEKNPNAGELVNMLAGLYVRLGRVDDAVAVYDAAIKRNGGSPEISNNYAMLLVNHRQDPASLAKAQALADQLSNLSAPSFVDTRGWVKYKSGDYRSAMPLLEQAVDAAPDSPTLHYHLGMAQEKTGDLLGAEKNLSLAMNASRPFEGMDDARSALTQLKKSR